MSRESRVLRTMGHGMASGRSEVAQPLTRQSSGGGGTPRGRRLPWASRIIVGAGATAEQKAAADVVVSDGYISGLSGNPIQVAIDELAALGGGEVLLAGLLTVVPAMDLKSGVRLSGIDRLSRHSSSRIELRNGMTLRSGSRISDIHVLGNPTGLTTPSLTVVSSATDVTVDGCMFESTSAPSIVISNGASVVIRDCVFWTHYKLPQTVRPWAVYGPEATLGQSRVLIEDCLFSTGQFGAYHDGASTDFSRTSVSAFLDGPFWTFVRNCTFDGPTSTGQACIHAAIAEFTGNTVRLASDCFFTAPDAAIVGNIFEANVFVKGKESAFIDNQMMLVDRRIPYLTVFNPPQGRSMVAANVISGRHNAQDSPEMVRLVGGATWFHGNVLRAPDTKPSYAVSATPDTVVVHNDLRGAYATAAVNGIGGSPLLNLSGNLT
ncbi:MAG: hypothetical protein KatS3mg014_2453 [Actinomycetota bacterium]|nr:MAG: hypothetical protein KatS3mg014_2453 [Actinomycetota bacterium]